MTVAIIFGGAGFVGTHLARRLVASGQFHEVVSADVRPPRMGPVAGVRYVDCDVRKPIPRDVASGVTEIYNLAAVHTTPGHPPHEYYETNVLGAIHVTDYAADVGAPFVVFTSSISVYGPTETVKVETSPLEPTSDYGRSKIMAEEIHRLWLKNGEGRRLITVRPAVIYGPGENGNFTRLAKSLKKGMFFYPGRKDTVKACGYVGELIRTLEFVKGLGRTDVTYNFCYPKNYTIEEICRTYVEVGGLKPPTGLVPGWALLTAATGFEALNLAGARNSINRPRVRKLMESTTIAPAFLIDNGYQFETDLAQSLQLWRAQSPDFE